MKAGFNPAIASRVAPAIVRLTRVGGQGVIVPGGFVVTAAHCIGWTATGMQALSPDDYREEILTADARRLVVTPFIVEPVTDLAVLGVVDGQRDLDAAEAFEDFCAITSPVPLATDELVCFVPRAAYVFTHNKGIVRGSVTQYRPGAGILSLEADELIEGGTSGGPVVTRDGRLWGIVSHSGQIPHVYLAAPIWLVRQMLPPAVQRKLDTAFPQGRMPQRLLRRLTRSARRG